MRERLGEKIGWTGGWTGGFIWVGILSVALMVQKKCGLGLVGMLLAATAWAVIIVLAPWRHPSTPYWKLMLLPYGLFFVSIAWALWTFGGPEPLGFNGWNLLWLIPALSPFGMLGNRKWSDAGGDDGSRP